MSGNYPRRRVGAAIVPPSSVTSASSHLRLSFSLAQLQAADCVGLCTCSGFHGSTLISLTNPEL